MTPAVPTYHPRLADRHLNELVATFPAVMITGARATGKTTSARQCAADLARLDLPGTAAAFRADPDAALRRASRPLLIDEWQEVPQVLGAVKRAVDADPKAGQFILTGSVRAELSNEMWAGTGRVVRMSMYGLTEREVTGSLDPSAPAFVERLATSGISGLRLPDAVPAIDDYLARAVRGGFPEAVFRLTDERARRLWMRSYLDDLITRDAAAVGQAKDPAKLRRYLTALALHNAGLPTEAALYRAAGINAKTAAAYDQLLTNLYAVDVVPAWALTGNRLKALVTSPKRYLVDTGMAAAAAVLTLDEILSDSDLLGRFFDAFGAAQLRPEVALMANPATMHHLRTQGGRQEIDLVFDMGRGRSVGIEFKAASAVSASDAKHLLAFRDDIGSDFLAGAVLYAGRDLYQLSDRVFAVPLCAVWT